MGKVIMPLVPGLLLIGAGGRNSGKTAVACEVIRAWKPRAPIYALKIIGIDEGAGACHRGEKGCGLCKGLASDYEYGEDFGELPEKDTARMLAAGARRAYLLRSRRRCLGRAFDAFLRELPRGAVLVAESNSLRSHVRPGAFAFFSADGFDEREMKPSALAVYRKADVLLTPRDGDVTGRLTLSFSCEGDACIRAAAPVASDRPAPIENGGILL